MVVVKIQSSKYYFYAALSFLCSIILNIFLSYNLFLGNKWNLSWSTRAAAEAEAVASISCSAHGRAYLDGVVDGKPVCECNTCFDGPDCSNFIPGCAADVNRWALVKDESVYKTMFNYTDENTFGVSRDTQLIALNLIKVVLEGNGRSIFEFGHGTMRKRWERLSQAIALSNRFTIQEIAPQFCNFFQRVREPSPAYAWLKCERAEDEDCYKVLKSGGILGREGTLFGANSRYVRLSLINTQDDFDLLLHRVNQLVLQEASGFKANK